MANPKQVELLCKGVYSWNRWHSENPEAAIDLREAHLANLDLGSPGGHLRLQGADLENADLSHTNLSYADLSGARLCGSNLHFGSLERAELFDADLSGARLTWTNLSRAHFTSVKLARAVFGFSVIADVGFRGCTGLDSALHEAGSSIGVDTLVRSWNELPGTFLRGCGLPEPFIANLQTLIAAMEPIQFYSCFISYSNADERFAKRLHTGLQDHGVRCWFAPESLKIGDKFRSVIDESIRGFDKLLVILSEYSITSTWVEEEVEAALEQERREKRLVLFPVRLDDAVMETHTAWAANVRRTRHIGDFRYWRRQKAFEKAFGRLLCDLKAGG